MGMTGSIPRNDQIPVWRLRPSTDKPLPTSGNRYRFPLRDTGTSISCVLSSLGKSTDIL